MLTREIVENSCPRMLLLLWLPISTLDDAFAAEPYSRTSRLECSCSELSWPHLGRGGRVGLVAGLEAHIIAIGPARVWERERS